MFVYKKWQAIFANDAEFNLICEILYDEKDVGVIRRKDGGLVIEWFKSEPVPKP